MKLLRKKKSSAPSKSKRELSIAAAAYDLDGDGILDETEQAMRSRDRSGRGYLTNDEIFGIVSERLSLEKDAHRLKKAVVGLFCFVFVLALSNLGTSFASAILAREMVADEEASTMTDVRTG
ncbi:hypothetical protein ACHAXS_010727, partial [Conticribra weissflogii]